MKERVKIYNEEKRVMIWGTYKLLYSSGKPYMPVPDSLCGRIGIGLISKVCIYTLTFLTFSCRSVRYKYKSFYHEQYLTFGLLKVLVHDIRKISHKINYGLSRLYFYI